VQKPVRKQDCLLVEAMAEGCRTERTGLVEETDINHKRVGDLMLTPSLSRWLRQRPRHLVPGADTFVEEDCGCW
jgi:hypothetical protein